MQLTGPEGSLKATSRIAAREWKGAPVKDAAGGSVRSLCLRLGGEVIQNSFGMCQQGGLKCHIHWTDC